MPRNQDYLLLLRRSTLARPWEPSYQRGGTLGAAAKTLRDRVLDLLASSCSNEARPGKAARLGGVVYGLKQPRVE